MAIVEQASNTAIGWLGWGLTEESDMVVSFGYALRPAFWQRGYMTEAVRGMIGWLFATLDVDLVRAHCAETNRASARVLEKAELQLVKIVTETDENSVTERYRYYAISREAWLSLRSRSLQ